MRREQQTGASFNQSDMSADTEGPENEGHCDENAQLVVDSHVTWSSV
jgi:hypothetical protein